MNIGKRSEYGVAFCLLVSTSACAPAMHPEIEKADKVLESMKSDKAVEHYAPRALSEADRAVSRAKMHWRSHKDEAEAQHLAYVAGRRLDIVNAMSAQKQAEEATKELHARRNQDIVDARTEEAQKAERSAAISGAKAEYYREKSETQQVQLEQLTEKLKGLEARQTDRGLQFTLSDVLFETDKTDLKPGALRTLEPLAEFVRNNPEQTVTIEGHTDNKGSEVYNRELSRKRAAAVKQQLVALKVDPARISVRNMGEEFPRSSNDTEAGRLENRRVEIYVASK